MSMSKRTGYVKFEEPLIMHGALENSTYDIQRIDTLVKNGEYLDEQFGTDTPNCLKRTKLYFKEKYGGNCHIYIVNVQGYDIAISDLENSAEETFSLPEHLFEI